MKDYDPYERKKDHWSIRYKWLIDFLIKRRPFKKELNWERILLTLEIKVRIYEHKYNSLKNIKHSWRFFVITRPIVLLMYIIRWFAGKK